jgi:AraC-like DNA-binding protein
MKPHLLKVQLKTDHSFSVRYDTVPHFYDQWHYHPEIELVHIHKGIGTRFIGNKIERFKPDEMILLGSNLPHLFRCDKKYYDNGKTLKAEASVVHFVPSLLGDAFYNLPENKSLTKLFNKSKQGIKITGKTKNTVSLLIEKLYTAQGMARLILLLDILYCIAVSKGNRPISAKSFDFSWGETENNRLNSIYQYILANFCRGITLEQIAAVANLTPHSFCRYFKSRTKKTFSVFMLEIRIENACKLLNETDKSVADVCYESGFNNFSNFNRYFKNLTGYTPLQYKKNSQQE